jgi:Zn-dependent protease/predicted transcriptional regulator
MDWGTTMWLGILMLSIFFCVVLHEFGHALTARRFGVKTKDIILSPIGGVARLEKLPEKPIHEFYVAVAGPLVNLLIVVLLMPYFFFYSLEEVSNQLSSFNLSSPFEIIPFLLIGNILLAGFNLIPAFPMDGGRIFRSLLSIKLGRLKATKLASLLGNFFGILMVVYAVYTQSIITGFIGIFVFLLASQEYRMVKMDEALKNHFLSEIYRSNFTKIFATDQIEKAIEELKHGLEKNFLVFDENEKVIGVLHEMFILEAIKSKDFEGPVLEYMSQHFEEVSPEISLQSLISIIREKGYSILPVFEGNQLKGVVDVIMLNNFIKLQQKVS